ncbi:MAG: thioredoxin fold domain-containing protein, partial [Gammaproteobacteria bacterium]|nr:thioredoxin fold domain-containing protein [Gammaproteobacteria bacterium]
MPFLILLFLLPLSFASIAAAPPDMGEFLGAKVVDELPDWFKASFMDLSEDLKEATNEDRHVMIYFHQNGCPYCAKLVEENFQNPSLVAKLKRNFDVIETNLWGDRALTDWQGRDFSEKEFSALMRVQFTPTILFLNAHGETILRLNGYQSVEKMNHLLDYVSAKKYLNQSFSSYINLLKKDRLGELNTNSLFEAGPHILTRSEKFPAQNYLAVFFEEPNCAECDTFHQTLMSLEKTRALLKPMQVIQLNALSDTKIITPSGRRTTAKKWYEALKLTYKPAIVFFDPQGNEVIRKDALFKAYHLHGIMSYVSSGEYQQQPNFQRYLEDQ